MRSSRSEVRFGVGSDRAWQTTGTVKSKLETKGGQQHVSLTPFGQRHRFKLE